ARAVAGAAVRTALGPGLRVVAKGQERVLVGHGFEQHVSPVPAGPPVRAAARHVRLAPPGRRRGTSAWRRKLSHPRPPLPPLTKILTRSTNMGHRRWRDRLAQLA